MVASFRDYISSFISGNLSYSKEEKKYVYLKELEENINTNFLDIQQAEDIKDFLNTKKIDKINQLAQCNWITPDIIRHKTIILIIDGYHNWASLNNDFKQKFFSFFSTETIAFLKKRQ